MSIHRATVINNVDPMGLGRLQVDIADVASVAHPWALPVLPLGTPRRSQTPVGAAVWVLFENDDIDRPVVLGRLPAR